MDPVGETIKPKLRPLTVAELFPEYAVPGNRLALMQSSQKQPRDTIQRPAKLLVPLRVSEMPEFNEFNNSPKPTQRKTSLWNQKKWNSSAKMESKNVKITGNSASTQEKFQHSKIRKALNFMSKPEAQTVTSNVSTKPKCKVVTPKQTRKSIKDSRVTSLLSPLFVKPGAKVLGRKSIFYKPAKATSPPQLHKHEDKNTKSKLNMPRISGVGELENISTTSFEKPTAKIPNTNENHKNKNTTHLSPLTECEISSTDSSDRSFLQEEKESCRLIPNDTENISVSTPFKHYRPVVEFFNVSNNAEISLSNRDIPQQNLADVGSFYELSQEKNDETMIAKLCDMLSNADFRSKGSEEERKIHLRKLTEMKQELGKTRCFLQKQMHFLIGCQKSNEKAINIVNDMLNSYHSENSTKSCVKNNGSGMENVNNDTVVQQPENNCRTTKTTKLPRSQSLRVQKQRTVSLGHKDSRTSPSFSLPRKNPCLRKRTLYKSLPMDINITEDTDGENIPQNRATSVYMQMKKSWSFLKTPIKAVKHDSVKTLHDITNTPSSMATSLNLQRQLDRLYNGDS